MTEFFFSYKTFSSHHLHPYNTPPRSMHHIYSWVPIYRPHFIPPTYLTSTSPSSIPPISTILVPLPTPPRTLPPLLTPPRTPPLLLTPPHSLFHPGPYLRSWPHPCPHLIPRIRHESSNSQQDNGDSVAALLLRTHGVAHAQTSQRQRFIVVQLRRVHCETTVQRLIENKAPSLGYVKHPT